MTSKLLNASCLVTVILQSRTFLAFAAMVLSSVLIKIALLLGRDFSQFLQKNYMITKWARANHLCYSRSTRWASLNSRVIEQVWNIVVVNIKDFSSLHDGYDRHWCSALTKDKQRQQQHQISATCMFIIIEQHNALHSYRSIFQNVWNKCMIVDVNARDVNTKYWEFPVWD